MGMFYRWSIDLADPFPQSEYGNYYIMVMIEHISKWVEVVTILTKESCETLGCSAYTYYARTGHQLRC